MREGVQVSQHGTLGQAHTDRKKTCHVGLSEDRAGQTGASRYQRINKGIVFPLPSQSGLRLTLVSYLQPYRFVLMAVLSLPLLWGAFTFFAAYVAGKCSAQPVTPGNCSVDTFTSVLPANAIIERVDYVPDGAAYGEGPKDLGYPNNVTGLPELCAVIVNVTSSPSSNFRFGLFLPTTDNWNGKILTMGNGGFLGGINWRDMGPGPHYGFATLSTDTGHISANGDLTWGYNDPETVTDWGWRAIQ